MKGYNSVKYLPNISELERIPNLSVYTSLHKIVLEQTSCPRAGLTSSSMYSRVNVWLVRDYKPPDLECYLHFLCVSGLLMKLIWRLEMARKNMHAIRTFMSFTRFRDIAKKYQSTQRLSLYLVSQNSLDDWFRYVDKERSLYSERSLFAGRNLNLLWGT